jgi:hypothetical protein
MGMLLRAILGPEVITPVVQLVIIAAEIFWTGYLIGKDRGKKERRSGESR